MLGKNGREYKGEKRGPKPGSQIRCMQGKRRNIPNHRTADLAERRVLKLLEVNTAAGIGVRANKIGRVCQPPGLKRGWHRQWADRVLLRLMKKDLVGSYRGGEGDSGSVYYFYKKGVDLLIPENYCE